MRLQTSIGCLVVLTAGLNMGGCTPFGTLTSESRLPPVTALPADDSLDDSPPISRSGRLLSLLAAQLQQPPPIATTYGSSVYVGPLTTYRDFGSATQAEGGVATDDSTAPPQVDTPEPTEEPPPIITRGPVEGEHLYTGTVTGTVTEIAEGADRIGVWDAEEFATLLIDREHLTLKAVYIPGMVYSPDIMVPLLDPGISYEADGTIGVGSGWRWHITTRIESHESNGPTITAVVRVQTSGVFGNMTWSMEALHTTTVQLHGMGLIAAHYVSDTPYQGIWDVPTSGDPIFPMDVAQRHELAGELISPD